MSAAVISALVTYGPWIIAGASAAAAAMPQANVPGSAWFIIRSVLDVLAINVGNAKNAKPQAKV
jgi:hypothetical protein